MTLDGKEYNRVDFSGQDFSGQDLSGRKFSFCKFDRANLTDAEAHHSDFRGSSFVDTNCHGTNFKNSLLAYTDFRPKDCYGMTVTLECMTFKGMRIGLLWWMAWQMFAVQMEPELDRGRNLKLDVIAMIGAQRYARLTKLFQREI